jgi:hypothetical protein
MGFMFVDKQCRVESACRTVFTLLYEALLKPEQDPLTARIFGYRS